jgi:hydrogenase nickel incorporation protein HypA/HybF
VHEIGIANSILEAVRQETARVEAARHGAARVRRICVRIGTLAGVDADALRFGFEALTRDSDFADLELEIELCPRVHRCPACGTEFAVAEYEFRCPQCGEEKTQFVSGDQLELAYMEIDEHEPSAA